MPNLLSARSRSHGVGSGGGNDEGRTGDHACYGIIASAVTLLLFCALAAAVDIWIAFAFGGLALVAFAAASCLAPASWRAGPSDAATATAEAAVGAAAPARRRFGLTKAAIGALPTFPYAQREGTTADGGDDLESGGSGDLEAGDSVTCPVCLEDVRAGDMVRQLPACGHMFHVECIDMWLHSHRTCPVCRSNLSPPQKVPGKAAAVTDDTGPVVDQETEAAPADDAVSQV